MTGSSESSVGAPFGAWHLEEGVESLGDERTLTSARNKALDVAPV